MPRQQERTLPHGKSQNSRTHAPPDHGWTARDPAFPLFPSRRGGETLIPGDDSAPRNTGWWTHHRKRECSCPLNPRGQTINRREADPHCTYCSLDFHPHPRPVYPPKPPERGKEGTSRISRLNPPWPRWTRTPSSPSSAEWTIRDCHSSPRPLARARSPRAKGGQMLGGRCAMDTGTNRASKCESSITRGKHATMSFSKLVVIIAMATTASHRVSPDRKPTGG
jgi:hypothetical protein